MNNLLAGLVPFYGFEVVSDSSLTSKEWRFPYRRFVEWEAKDEDWARKLGFGHEVTVPSKDAYQVGNKLIMHPDMIAALCAEVDKRNNYLK